MHDRFKQTPWLPSVHEHGQQKLHACFCDWIGLFYFVIRLLLTCTENKLDGTPHATVTANPSHHSLPFYRAMLCIRGTSHDPVSVRLSVRQSVTSRCSTKTAKRSCSCSLAVLDPRVGHTMDVRSPFIPVVRYDTIRDANLTCARKPT